MSYKVIRLKWQNLTVIIHQGNYRIGSELIILSDPE